MLTSMPQCVLVTGALRRKGQLLAHWYEEPKGFPSRKNEAGSWYRSGGLRCTAEMNEVKTSVVVGDENKVAKFADVDPDTQVERGMSGVPKVGTADAQLAEYFRRPRLLITSSVTSSTVMSGICTNVFGTWSLLPGVAHKLAGYVMFRGDLVLKVIYAGNPQLMGLVVFPVYPLIIPGGDTDSSTLANPIVPDWFTNIANYTGYAPNMLMLPHLKMAVNEPCSCELKLPFPQNVSMMPIATGADYYLMPGILNNVVMSNGSTPSTISFEVYASYENVELIGTIPESGEMEETPLQRNLGYASRLLESVPLPFVSVWSKVASTASAWAGSLGWSRPLTVQNQTAIVATPSLSFISGQGDFSQSLGVHPGQTLDISGARIPMYDAEQTKVRWMCSQFDLVMWNVNVATYTYVNVDPLAAYLTYNGAWSSGTKLVCPLTRLGFATSMFLYWRGSLEYEVEFVANAFVRGRVALQYYPAGYTGAYPVAYDGNATYKTLLVDVVGLTKVRFTCDYTYMENFHQSPGPITYNSSNSGMGRLYIFPLSAWQGNGTSAPVVTANVSVRGGPDFELAKPALTWINTWSTCLSTTVPEAGESVLLFGEKIEDLQSLTRRPCPNCNGAFPASSCSSYNPDGILPMPSVYYGVTYGASQPLTLGAIEWTFATWLRMAYMGVTGGTRYKMIPSSAIPATVVVQELGALIGNSTTSGTPTVNPFANNLDYSSAGGSVQYNAAYKPYYEIEFPSHTTRWFRFGPRVNFNSGTTPVARLCASFATNNIAAFNYSLWFSGADDYTVGGFLCVPVIMSLV